jgi:transaldolase
VNLIENIRKMYGAGDGHVRILAASIRNTDQLLACLAQGVDLVTAPAKVLDEWAAEDFPLPDGNFVHKGVDATANLLKPIPYRDIELKKPWEMYDPNHELTRKGIERFVADFESTLHHPASAA